MRHYGPGSRRFYALATRDVHRLSGGPAESPGETELLHPTGKVGVDHIAYTLADWDTDKKVRPAVEAELKRRGLKIQSIEGGFHVEDPDGFGVQMGGKRQ
jgi:hypothetical protein